MNGKEKNVGWERDRREPKEEWKDKTKQNKKNRCQREGK